MMSYNQYQPAPEFAAFIECYWDLKGIITNDEMLIESLVPGGRAEIILGESTFLWYGENKDSVPEKLVGSVLLGQRESVNYIGLMDSFHFFGIRFRYGCQSLFLKQPANNYSNRIVLLSQLKALNDIPFDSKALPTCQINLIENALRKNMGLIDSDWSKLQQFIRELEKEEERQSIKMLSAKYGWSYKKCERVFLRHTGYTPKAFMRVVRFRKMLEQSGAGPGQLTRKAYDFGFYDQSHLIREFYVYAGEKPTSFYDRSPILAGFLYGI